MMWDYYTGYEHPVMGGWFLNSFISIIFWIIIIGLILFIIRRGFLFDHHSHDRVGKTALDILKERYAKGEIEKEEFEQKKKDLVE